MKQYFFDTFYMAERDVIGTIKYRMCTNSDHVETFWFLLYEDLSKNVY